MPRTGFWRLFGMAKVVYYINPRIHKDWWTWVVSCFHSGSEPDLSCKITFGTSIIILSGIAASASYVSPPQKFSA
jgi:hypothetical protein